MEYHYNECKIERVINITSVYTAFENTYCNAYKFEGESHDFWEIVCVLGGSVGETADNAVYSLLKGQAIIHRPMEFHKLWAENGTSPHVAIFTFGASAMPEIENSVYNLTSENLRQIDDLISLSKEIFDVEYYLKFAVKNGKNMQLQGFVSRLETFVLSVLSNKTAENTEHKSVSAKNYTKIISVLEKNISENLSVLQIAELCSMSEPSLKKTFYKYTGEGIIHYFTLMKIRKATEMLKNGISVKEAANELGFVNQNYFSTVFKRVTGSPPSKFKKILM